MMNRSRPLTRILISFSLGSWIGLDHPFVAAQTFGLTVILMVFTFLVLHKKGWLPYANRWMAGLVIQLAVFISAWTIASLQDERLSNYHETAFTADAVLLELTGKPILKQKGYRCEASIVLVKPVENEIRLRNKTAFTSHASSTCTLCDWKAAQGKVLLYFPRDALSLPVEGDLLFVKGPVSRLEPPEYPGQFDFKRYCELNACYGAIHMRQGKWVAIGHSDRFSLMRSAHLLRDKLISSFHDAGLKDQELAVVSALVLGDDDAVDAGLLLSFSATGTLHVLSVSGMHVGLIYTLVAFLLGKLFKRSKKKWPLPFTVLTIVWMYALLTGLSPAVQRSAMMISLLLMGKTIFKSADTWNLLCGSFMVLVSLDPSLIRSAGFQLSYAAVAGILGFYPWLYKQLYLRSSLLDLLWKSVCVALAAQVFTFPLGLYYFHQFPNYFLPANLVIIPFSTAVLFGGVVLTLLIPFPVLSAPAGGLLSVLTQWLNKSVNFFGALPHAQLSGIWIDGPTCLMLMLSVTSGTLFLCRKENRWLFTSLMLMVAVGAFLLFKQYQHQSRVCYILWGPREGSGFTVTLGNAAITCPALGSTPAKATGNGHLHDALDALEIPVQRRETCDAHFSFDRNLPLLWVNPYLVLPDTVIRIVSAPPRYAKGMSP